MIQARTGTPVVAKQVWFWVAAGIHLPRKDKSIRLYRVVLSGFQPHWLISTLTPRIVVVAFGGTAMQRDQIDQISFHRALVCWRRR